jgi:hypothetical protein
MEQYEYNGVNYWILIENAFNIVTGHAGFIAYFNNQPPGGLLYGRSVKDDQERTIFFGSRPVAIEAAKQAIRAL